MLKQFRKDYGEAWKHTDWFAVALIYAKIGIGWMLDLIRFIIKRGMLRNKNYEFISLGEYHQMCWNYVYENLFDD